jgi:hypothetical protein
MDIAAPLKVGQPANTKGACGTPRTHIHRGPQRGSFTVRDGAGVAQQRHAPADDSSVDRPGRWRFAHHHPLNKTRPETCTVQALGKSTERLNHSNCRGDEQQQAQTKASWSGPAIELNARNVSTTPTVAGTLKNKRKNKAHLRNGMSETSPPTP